MSEAVEWRGAGEPYSPRFADIYRSAGAAALPQAQQVFLAGCGLPQAWAGQARCRILETGFGLGLNFLVTWAAWQADARPCTELHFLSVEAYPVAADDLLRSAQALQATGAGDTTLLPQLQALARELAAAWSGVQAGVQTLHFAQGRVRLTLAVGEAQTMLAQLDGPVDAVFLDGFSPARNPAMWSQPTLQEVARLCRPGTRLASWTVAGEVRSRLRSLGFEVHKRAGLPPKRQRLEAVYAI